MTLRVANMEAQSLRSRTALGLCAGTAVLAFLLIVHALAPYLFKPTTLQNEFANQVRLTTGLTISSQRARFDLLPQPHIVLHDVVVSDKAGLVHLESERMAGDVRLLPLLVGRIEVSAISLRRPKLILDVAGQAIASESLLGRALRGGDNGRGSEGQRLGTLTFVDGAVEIRRSGHLIGLPMNDVNATAEWQDTSQPVLVAGSLKAQGTRFDLSAYVAHPERLARGEPSNVETRLHAAFADIALNGDLAIRHQTEFKGHLSASTSSLPDLLAIAPDLRKFPVAFNAATIESGLSIKADTSGPTAVDLQEANFAADGNRFEGSLAYTHDDRPLISGTLATDYLTLAPFLKRTALFDKDRSWSRNPIVPTTPFPINVDLRLSANHLQVEPLTVDDAALSVMTRGDQLELSLNEGRICGGDAKARLTFSKSASGLKAHIAGLLNGADLGTLSLDASGAPAMTGKMSASANLETTGQTPAELARAVQGWVKLQASDGTLLGVDFGRDLEQTTRGSDQGLMRPYDLLRGRASAFTNARLEARIENGRAFIDQGQVNGATTTAQVSGSADIGAQSLDAQVDVAAAPKLDPSGKARLTYLLTGRFNRIHVSARVTAAPKH